MNEQTRAVFEAWLNEPHPADQSTTRRDYMPRHGEGFAAMAWQAATFSERERCAVKAKQCGYDYFADAIRGSK